MDYYTTLRNRCREIVLAGAILLAMLPATPANAQICTDGGGSGCHTVTEDFTISGGTPDFFLTDTDVGQSEWKFLINSSSSVGPSFFELVQTGTATPFRIDGGARGNSIRVLSDGRVGLGTATPAQELHIMDANVGFGPAIQFQDNSGQNWQLEADNFTFAAFDETEGSRPFQIETGAPDSMLYIQSSGRVGIGTAGPAEELHVFSSDNANTIIRAENTNAAGSTAASAIQSKADVAQVSFQSHGSGRTISRFGKTLGGWNEMLGVFGNGFIIGTLFDKPLIFGTNGQNRLEITASGDVVHFSAGKVHPDYVFEPSYELESIEDHARSMWSSKHLPGVGAGEYAADGRAMFKLGAGRAGMLEELEKAHIYIDQLNEEVKQKDERIAALEQNVAASANTLQDVSGRLSALESRLAGYVFKDDPRQDGRETVR